MRHERLDADGTLWQLKKAFHIAVHLLGAALVFMSLSCKQQQPENAGQDLDAANCPIMLDGYDIAETLGVEGLDAMVDTLASLHHREALNLERLLGIPIKQINETSALLTLEVALSRMIETAPGEMSLFCSEEQASYSDPQSYILAMFNAYANANVELPDLELNTTGPDIQIEEIGR